MTPKSFTRHDYSGCQEMFSPIQYGFEWTTDGWYKWDSKEAHKKARQERDSFCVNLRMRGKEVKKFTLPKQLVKRGGIGTGHPEIEEIVTVYGVNYRDK